MVAATVAYYDRHAVDFASQTHRLDMSAQYGRFLPRIPPGGRILDAGCGTGRDAAVFLTLDYAVTAIDASAAMAEMARGRTRGAAEVRHMRFDVIRWDSAFDGIWANASLLHVPLEEFARVGTVLARELRPGGAWFIETVAAETRPFTAGRSRASRQRILCEIHQHRLHSPL